MVPAGIVGLLVAAGVPYPAYMAGGRWLVRLLGKHGRHVRRLVGIRKRGTSAAPKADVPAYHREGGVRKHRRGAREPWILATSLQCSARAVVAIYAKRMQIEQTFRDAKSSRFGVSLSHARTTSVDRANVLLLLAALVHAIAVLVGVAAEAARLHLREQANTLVGRRVLSLAILGLLRSAVSGPGWGALESRVAVAAQR